MILLLLLLVFLPAAHSYSFSGSCTDSHDCLHKWHADVFNVGLVESEGLKTDSKNKLGQWNTWPFDNRQMYPFSRKKESKCSTGINKRVAFHYTGENLHSGTAAFASFSIKYFTTLMRQKFNRKIKGEFGCAFSLDKKIILCTYCV